MALLVVLLGGEAGLRCGEIMALEWTDIDFAKRQLTVARSECKGHVTMPKGGRLRRESPMIVRRRRLLQVAQGVHRLVVPQQTVDRPPAFFASFSSRIRRSIDFRESRPRFTRSPV